MAHELSINEQGIAEMGFLEGVQRWHGLGSPLRKGATTEEWQKVSMPFSLRKAKLLYHADRAGTDAREVDDQVALVRSDNGRKVGIVSPDYNIVQPLQVLEFFRDLVPAGFELNTAGTLFGGRKFWALAKLTEAVIAGWDKVGGYLLLSTTCDGSESTDARETTVCVVCNNTLSMALSAQGGNIVKVSHRQTFDPDRVKADLGLVDTRANFEAFMEAVAALSRVKVDESAAERFVLDLLAPADEIDEERARLPRGFEKVLTLFEGGGIGSDRKGRNGTAWGLVNAVTEYVDHHAPAKTDDHRMQRAMYGPGNALKSAAMANAMALL